MPAVTRSATQSSAKLSALAPSPREFSSESLDALLSRLDAAIAHAYENDRCSDEINAPATVVLKNDRADLVNRGTGRLLKNRST